jgi:aspartyl-tRNA(Asn)/glutamyl-tRNA(Gln) amidotransferase subunit B
MFVGLWFGIEGFGGAVIIMTVTSKSGKIYYPTIGIECHVQFNTKTKLFAAVSNDATTAKPNTLINHICLGMPGALPVLNKKAIELASRAAFAFKTRPQKFSKFDRKHYFYPDLPKGYQITQFEEPIIVGGEVLIHVDGKDKVINLTRAHLEEDAGKNTHPDGSEYSLVDLNRAGTPLLEIVSEPEINSAQEARAFAKELYLLVKYANVSDADMYHGNMRVDVNVSVSPNPDILGTRTETKNLNSFKSVEKAVEYEIKRQIDLLEKGEKIVQETRGWNDAKQKTFSQRSKEEAFDYRYFPEPDLPPVLLEDSYIAKIESSMPKLPFQIREELKSKNVQPDNIEILLDNESSEESHIYTEVLLRGDYSNKELQFIANMMVMIEIPARANKEANLNDVNAENRQKMYKDLYKLSSDGLISSTNCKELLKLVLAEQKLPLDLTKLAEDKGLVQESDESSLSTIIDQVINDSPKAFEDIKNGELKAVGFIVGQVMKLSGG